MTHRFLSVLSKAEIALAVAGLQVELVGVETSPSSDPGETWVRFVGSDDAIERASRSIGQLIDSKGAPQ